MKKFKSMISKLAKIILAVSLLLSISCKDQTSEALIPNFDKLDDLSESDNNLSSLTESSRIIKLETVDDCLIGSIRKIVKNNSLFFIKTAEDELVLFDNQGNYMHKIGNKGRGPGEYIRIKDFAVTENGAVVAVACLKDIHFYNVTDGSFIKKQSFDYYINSLIYLPDQEILAQVTQTDSLIAHIDIKGNIINSFGTMSLALELELPFEFVRLDDSNFIYKIGQTTDYYHYNQQNKKVYRSQLFEDEDALREQELHERLVAQGPDPMAYRNLADFFETHYRVMYLKKLKTNFFLYYLYNGKFYIMLYNWKDKTKKEFIFRPQESSNLTDDILFLPTADLFRISAFGSDDNSILTYFLPNTFIQNYDSETMNHLKQSDRYEEVVTILDSLKVEDNPIIVEYYIEEI